MEHFTASTLTAIKNSGLVLAFIAGMKYLNLNHEVMLLLGVLIVIDVFTGVIRSWILDGKKTVTSNRFMAGMVAKGLTLLIPVVMGLGGKAIGFDFTPVIVGFIFVLALGFMYSIIGNIYALQSKQEKDESEAVAILHKIIRNMFVNAVESLKALGEDKKK